MLADRIIGAFTFRKGVYAEVEKDTSFTTTAWILVAVIGFLQQFGTYAAGGIGSGIIGAIVGMIAVVIGFAAGTAVIAWLGRSMFQADVQQDELVRTLGLAYIWNIIGVIGGLAAFSRALTCVLGLPLLVGAILCLIAWFVAAKEALDLDWGKTIITVVAGFIVLLIVMAIAGAILGILGVATGAVPVPAPTS